MKTNENLLKFRTLGKTSYEIVLNRRDIVKFYARTSIIDIEIKDRGVQKMLKEEITSSKKVAIACFRSRLQRTK